MRTLSLGLALTLALSGCGDASRTPPPDGETRAAATAAKAVPAAEAIPDAPGTRPDIKGVVPIASDDPQMAAAVARARAELPAFFARLLAKPAGTEAYQVKFNLTPNTGSAEYIWATGLDYNGKALAGRLSNIPEAPGFKMGQPMLIPIENIIDWGYFEDGRMVGHYTTAVVLEHVPPGEAAETRKALGWQ